MTPIKILIQALVAITLVHQLYQASNDKRFTDWLKNLIPDVQVQQTAPQPAAQYPQNSATRTAPSRRCENYVQIQKNGEATEKSCL